jgi:phage shock protein PspC (stress-responsive transcriptional regulator)
MYRYICYLYTHVVIAVHMNPLGLHLAGKSCGGLGNTFHIPAVIIYTRILHAYIYIYTHIYTYIYSLGLHLAGKSCGGLGNSFHIPAVIIYTRILHAYIYIYTHIYTYIYSLGLHLAGKSCGGLGDIFYVVAVIIKQLVDTDLAYNSLITGYMTMISLTSDSGLHEVLICIFIYTCTRCICTLVCI